MSSSNRPFVYLDNNATTRVDPEVFVAMVPFLTEKWGNPSSAYSFGNEVSASISKAREQVAGMMNADPREILFTSCGTESNNTAILSALSAFPKKKHIITTAVEHSSNIKFCKALKDKGYKVTFLPVEPDGLLDLHLLEISIRPDTAIVSIMWANNETGVVFPVEEIAAICRSKNVLFHSDAVQVAGKIPIDVQSLGIDMLSLSAHKLHAPKGIGCLYIRRRTPFHPMVIGGGQERGWRGGTENVAYIAGFGRAAELAVEHLPDENTRVKKLRDDLEKRLLKTIPRSSGNGSRKPRLPNTTNIAFSGIEAEAILLMLDQEGICASSGSACTTGSIEPSHVLTAMGLNKNLARGSVRFSLGRYNTQAEVDYVVEKMGGIVEKLRAVSPQPIRREAQAA